MTGLAWWYPVVAWGVAVASLVQSLAALRAGAVPRWLPPAVGCLTLVPIAGIPIGRWLHGLGQTFSIPFLLLLLDIVAAPFVGRAGRDGTWLDLPARRAATWWGAIAALLLYPAALGVGPFDPYVLGWNDSAVAAAAAAGGAMLALAGNRFGTVLLVAGAVWHLGLLESDNSWDYVVDPVYGSAAVVNLLRQGCLASLRRNPALIAGHTIAAVGVCLLGAGLHAAEPVALSALDEQWEATARDLVRRAERGEHTELATFVREWRLPDAPGRQRILRIPETVIQPGFVDTPEEEPIWSDFLAARRARAEGLFALAVEAARAHATLPTRAERAQGLPTKPLAQATSNAVALVYEALRDDPDHERARKAGGWVHRDSRWIWPEVARRLDAGDVRDAERGWIPTSTVNRPSTPRPGRSVTWASDHWKISSRADPVATAALASELEIAHDVWRQAFGGFMREPAEQEKAFEGRSRPMTHGPFAATLFGDRAAYVAELEKLEPTIARTLGLYWMPTRTAYFPPLDAIEDAALATSTIHHEAAHQLFAEMRKTSPLAGERCGFWALEAAACYVESLEPAPYGWTLGGRDAGRAPAARERLIDDDFYVSLQELCSLGRGELQADERLPAIYSQLSGLADFFMNGEQGKHREAFIEYLVRIYTGSVSPDTLSRLCGTTYADLDDAYRRHMAR
ncbi:MAG: hypothetical protein KGR24_02960 [Planctomycetes bacterium]|nr:hypothetical protein [Planctomycetota bacterium]